jgi:hypothetical protein
MRKCPFCGKAVSGLLRACPYCFRELPPDEETERPPLVIKRYIGQSQDIFRQYQVDLPVMESRGYRVESQQIIQGHRGGCLMALGVLTLGVLLLLARPSDTLMVTYRLKDPAK